MKKIVPALGFFLLSTTITAQTFPVETIVNNGLPEKRIKFVFLSDGYQAGELTNFTNQVNLFAINIFTQPPFKEYKNFFNFYAIKVPSVQSGCTHPGTATDEASSGGQPIAVANTYFNSTFDYSNIHRLVVPQNNSAIFSVLATNFPAYNQMFMFSNSSYYGGSGGVYATSTAHSSANEIAIHEIGHSFGGLADEYLIAGQGERPNRTMVTNPATVKWKNWLGTSNVGIYPIGIDGWQRPHQNCKMQYLGATFCPVCKEAFINKLYSLVTPIYDFTPTSSIVSVNAPTTFSATLTQPIPNTLVTDWKLNGTSIATNVNSVNITPAQLGAATNTLTLYVTDETPLSRSYLPTTGYVFSQTWTLTKGTVLPFKLNSFTAVKSGNSVLLDWETINEINMSHYNVQRSSDGNVYSTIGVVNSQTQNTSNNYHFVDNTFPPGTLYYKLELVDINGKSEFSDIRIIKESDKFYFEMSPNPVRDILTVKGNSNYDMDMTVEVFNAAGQKVYQKNQSVTMGTFDFKVNMINLKSGSYIVLLRLPNNFTVQRTIVKVN